MIWRSSLGKWEKVRFHNLAKGMTAVIVCNGPSLNAIDTARLAGPSRVVIGVNSSYPKVRPDYWLGMDKPANFNSDLWQEAFPKLLRSGSEHSAEMKTHRDFLGVHFIDFKVSGNEFECINSDEFVWTKDTFRAAIQFALHLGCKSLVFAGVDLDNSVSHYADGNYLTVAQAEYNRRLYDEQFHWLKSFADDASYRYGIRCYSHSPQSRINSFLPPWTPTEGGGVRAKLHCTDPSGQECDEFAAHQKRGGRPYSMGHRAMYLTACELLRDTKASLLEIGTGIGYGLGELLKAGAVGSYFGCEPCKASFDYASACFGETTQDITLALGGWRDVALPVADYSFCIEVFEHLHSNEREEFLLTLKSKTRKALFLSTPDSDKCIHGVVNESAMITLLSAAGFAAVPVSSQWTTFYLAIPKPKL